MSTNPELSEYARMLVALRWKDTTPEDRKAATAKAREARKANAAARRAARENGGGDTND
ncbi:hypothetical protein [Micromonospora sp. C81]|uniref:hypothetical protein n=1 Tax=Micromonospora sp. C81 TaxID=2824881 RepID=UPI001B38FD08|nr:hypothetical protein [Micromonospora sp. C81]MBQ1039299.1 hypothetical protein [Micromonospora sp. C81]